MRCPRCGNESPDGNRFCGMCGATLLTEAGRPVRVPAPAPVTATAAVERQESQHSEDRPSISGPSFLGLNDPAPRKRASLSIDPHSAHGSRNLDYLLDDEEAHSGGGGAGKFFLIVLALVLAAGFGYLRFKNHGIPWLNSGANKPSATASTPSEGDAGTPTPQPAASPSITPESQPAPVQPTPTEPAATTKQPTAESAPAHETTDTNPPADKSAAPPANEATSMPPADAASKSDDTASEDEKEPAEAAPPKPTSKRKPTAAAPQPKPPAASPTLDTVAEAQKYLYGRGAAQDCDRGLRLLKPQANQGNVKAMIEMGALYSAGLCAPHDLPTSYRWFAVALRKDPSNDAVQADLQKLWSEMTQPERQLAIKLTQ